MRCQKDLFSLREDEHYFNCAYKGPLLKSSEAASLKALLRERNPMDIKPETYFVEMPTVKDYFSKIINASAQQIALVPSTSYGFASILNNTKAKTNGNAITLKDEFPSGFHTLKKWCIQNANELIAIEPDEGQLIGESWNKNLLKQIDEKTSLVLMSSIHWMNGIKFDLEAIGRKCKAVGAKFIVDGTQSVGAMEMDVQKYQIDALVCAGYKWLLGPYSLSVAYFSDYYNDGVPIEESWLNRINSQEFSRLNEYEEQYRMGAGRYNVGETSNFILMPILRESLHQILKWDPNNIQQYCAELIKPLINYLEELNLVFEPEDFFCNHLFALKLPEEIDMERLKANFAKNNIFLSVRGKYIRIAVNVFNDEKDIEKLIEVIAESLDH